MSWPGAFTAAVAGLLMVQSAVASAQSAPSAYTTGHRYDLAGRDTGRISPDPDGAGPLHYAAVRKTYDAAGRLIKVETGELSTWQSEAIAPSAWTGFTVLTTGTTDYDALDRKIVERALSGTSVTTLTQYSYDLVGRLDCSAVRMNPANFASIPASACTLGTAGTQGPDRITKNIYDAAGQLLKVQKAYGTPLQQDYVAYTYSPNGQQKTVIDANGNKAAYTYDGFDRLAQWSFPSLTAPGTASTTDYEAYTYNANDNRLTQRRRDGRTLTFAYDALNRVTSKVVPDGCAPIQVGSCTPATATRDVYYGYDLQSHQLSARFDSASGADGITNAFDGFGQQTSSTIKMGSFTKTLAAQYDADGNRTQLTHPDGQLFTYTYDGLDRLSGVFQGVGTTTSLDQFTYNSQALLSARAERLGSAASYGYDPVGRLTSQADTFVGSTGNVTVGLGYNPASQIVSAARDNDAYAFNGLIAVNRNYAVNGLNQYTSAGPATFTYDANGNLTADGTNTYVYDAENRLIAASNGTSLTYDPLGRLWQVIKGTANTRFLVDGDALVAEYDATGTLTARYVHGSNAAADDPLVWYSGTNTRWLHANYQGSIVAMTDGSGAGTTLNAYDEYGIPGAANQGRFQYTGQAWLPELGMYYYKARIYSPTLGRFLQTDPIGYKDQINLYAYVANDPVDGRDPTGEYQRGVGFGDDEWKRFDKAQQQQAKSMDSQAGKLSAKADKMDKEKPGSGDLKRAAAANLRSDAAALRNTSSSAPTANILSATDYAKLGRPEGSQAFTKGQVTTFSRGSMGVFGSEGLGMKWTIGHEGFHTFGLKDQFGPNGALAYKGAEQRNTDSLNAIRGTIQATINPDSLLNGDN